MKITISGSIAFYHDMQKIKQELESKGHEVFAPELDSSVQQQKELTIEEKSTHMRNHLDQIAWADALLVFNPPKKGIDHYIGPNTLIEMGTAFYLHKPIYIMYDIPELPYSEEIKAMQPRLLKGIIKELYLP